MLRCEYGFVHFHRLLLLLTDQLERKSLSSEVVSQPDSEKYAKMEMPQWDAIIASAMAAILSRYENRRGETKRGSDSIAVVGGLKVDDFYEMPGPRCDGQTIFHLPYFTVADAQAEETPPAGTSASPDSMGMIRRRSLTKGIHSEISAMRAAADRLFLLQRKFKHFVEVVVKVKPINDGADLVYLKDEIRKIEMDGLFFGKAAEKDGAIELICIFEANKLPLHTGLEQKQKAISDIMPILFAVI